MLQSARDRHRADHCLDNMVHDTNGNVVDEGVNRRTFTEPAAKSLWVAPIKQKNPRSCDLMNRGLWCLRLLNAHGSAGTCTPGSQGGSSRRQERGRFITDCRRLKTPNHVENSQAFLAGLVGGPAASFAIFPLFRMVRMFMQRKSAHEML